jgi:hypothetical protein
MIHSPRPTALVISPNEPLQSLTTDQQPVLLNDEIVANWLAASIKFAPEANKPLIQKKFIRLKFDFQTIEQDSSDDKRWRNLAEASNSPDPSSAAYRAWLARVMGDWVCAPEGAPFVAEGLTFNQRDRLAALGEQLEAVRARMEAARESPEKCPGVTGFTDNDWKNLDSIKPTGSTPAAH